MVQRQADEAERSALGGDAGRAERSGWTFEKRENCFLFLSCAENESDIALYRHLPEFDAPLLYLTVVLVHQGTRQSPAQNEAASALK